MDHGLGLY